MRQLPKNARYQSLATRLSRWIVTLGTMIFIIVLGSNYYLSRSLLDDYVTDLAKNTASITVRKIEKIFDKVAASADSLASIVATTDIDDQQIHQSIKAILNTDTDIFGMAVALEPNTLIPALGDYSPYYYRQDDGLAYSDLAEISYQYKKWAWYSEPKKLGAAVWSEPYHDDGGGNVLMTTYSTPIYLGDEKKFAGIATADIQLSWLDQIVKEIKIGETGYGFIVSSQDVVIAHPDHSLNMKKLDKTRIGTERWQKYLDSKASTSGMYMNTQCLHQEGNCLIAVETLGETGWKVVIVLPEQELVSEINSLTIKVSIIAMIGLIILFLVVTISTRHLTKPLVRLTDATRKIGTGDLDSAIPEVTRNDEIGILTDDFNTMQSALKRYIVEVKESTAKQQKLESEIQIAQDIQMSMIPGAGNSSIEQQAYQLFAYLRPARTVGGDLYYYQQSDDALHFIIGDVSDKGVPAALFMAKTVTLYTRALKEKLSPGQTFSMMNDILAQNNDACMFVTALCGILDLNTGMLSMANAGHMDPVIHSGAVTREEKVDGGTALGLMEGVDYRNIDLQLSAGDSVVMYTDGISEAHNTQQQQFGDETLIALIGTVTFDDLSAAGKMIIDEVDRFASGTDQFDDITLFILRYE